jgi:phosphate starvation-inducible PhoH-like protein
MGRKSTRIQQQGGRNAPSFSVGSNLVPINQHWQQPQHFKALTANHRRMVRSIHENDITIVHGCAGTLKTFLALQTGLKLIKDRRFEKFIYARQNIQRPNEKGLGFRPGEESEKLSPLLKPIEDNLAAIAPPGEIDYLLRTKRIEGTDLEMLRGRSPLNAVIHLDEAQNTDLNGLLCVMTRLPESSKLILTGDFKGQRDIDSREFGAFAGVCREFKSHPRMAVIGFAQDDILRNELIKDILEGFDRIKAKI